MTALEGFGLVPPPIPTNDVGYRVCEYHGVNGWLEITVTAQSMIEGVHELDIAVEYRERRVASRTVMEIVSFGSKLAEKDECAAITQTVAGWVMVGWRGVSDGACASTFEALDQFLPDPA